jgi:hypothetical protein
MLHENVTECNKAYDLPLEREEWHRVSRMTLRGDTPGFALASSLQPPKFILLLSFFILARLKYAIWFTSPS